MSKVMLIGHSWYQQGTFLFFTDVNLQRWAWRYCSQLGRDQRLMWTPRQHDGGWKLVEWWLIDE